jgi:protein phosphatase
MPRDQAERIPLKHVLVRNIGVSPPSEPDIARFDALPGDAWLLCSDGLSNKLLHGDLLHLLTKSRGSSSDALRSMVEEAWHRGGEDNISAILMNLHPGA